MDEELSLPRLLKRLEQALDEFPDGRTGKNTRYDLPNAGLGAFSVFFTQTASFLAHQRALKLAKGRSNAERLFGPRHLPSDNHILPNAGLGAFSVFFTQTASFLAHQRALKLAKGRSNAERLFGPRHLPSDNHIRNLLDPVSPVHLWPVYRHVFQALERQVVLKSYRSFAQQLLVAIDGTTYFASKKIHCSNCRQRVLNNGEPQYFHQVLTPVIVQPDNPQVLALEPEFIVPQDGHDKQDCELQAAKRWLEQHGDFYGNYILDEP